VLRGRTQRLMCRILEPGKMRVATMDREKGSGANAGGWFVARTEKEKREKGENGKVGVIQTGRGKKEKHRVNSHLERVRKEENEQVEAGKKLRIFLFYFGKRIEKPVGMRSPHFENRRAANQTWAAKKAKIRNERGNLVFRLIRHAREAREEEKTLF